MENILSLFGVESSSKRKARESAETASAAAHAEAQESKRRRLRSEGETAKSTKVGDASMFLANRGTRYTGLKSSLGG